MYQRLNQQLKETEAGYEKSIFNSTYHHWYNW